MNSCLYVVYPGCADWRHPDWVGSIYPADLPEDWQFAFYQTQFRCVWLDAAAWQSIDETTWAALVADATGDFRFVLEELGSGLEGAPSGVPAAVRAALGERLVILSSESPARCVIDAETDLKVLAKRLQAATLTDPVFLIYESSALARMEQIESLIEILGI